MNVTFEEPSYGPKAAPERKPSFLSRIAIRLGLATDEAGAQKALAGVAIAVLVVTVILWVLA